MLNKSHTSRAEMTKLPMLLFMLVRTMFCYKVARLWEIIVLCFLEQSKRPFSSDFRVAIPGKFTTANSLFQFAFPDHPHTSEYLFSEIENAILDKRVDAGVIIHENRFTYQQKGLVKILDLGQFWESQTSLPIPLGGIAVSRTLNVDVQQNYHVS